MRSTSSRLASTIAVTNSSPHLLVSFLGLSCEDFNPSLWLGVAPRWAWESQANRPPLNHIGTVSVIDVTTHYAPHPYSLRRRILVRRLIATGRNTGSGTHCLQMWSRN